MMADSLSLAASLSFTKKSSLPSSGGGCKYTGQSVRALPIRILTVGKKRSRGVQLVVDDYIEKLRHYCHVDDIQVRSNPKNARDVGAQIEHEDIAVMDIIRSNDWVVMLDEHGVDTGSLQIAELIGNVGNTGASSLSFCIGGPYGHGRNLRERANMSIKLSSLVLNHQIALLVLVEQLYSWSINESAEELMAWRKVSAKSTCKSYLRLSKENLSISFLHLGVKGKAATLLPAIRS